MTNFDLFFGNNLFFENILILHYVLSNRTNFDLFLTNMTNFDLYFGNITYFWQIWIILTLFFDK